MAIRTIVVAFDFSEPSTRALRWAERLARPDNARLEVVHVFPDFDTEPAPNPSATPASDGQLERYLRFTKQELREAARELLGAHAEQIGVHVVRGDPRKRLLKSAQELQADLVVLGATGKGLGERALLGSVSEYVLRHSGVPVAIIR